MSLSNKYVVQSSKTLKIMTMKGYFLDVLHDLFVFMDI